MEKAQLILSQLLLFHKEYNKITYFYKESYEYFKKFSSSMKNSLNKFIKGTIFNEIEFMKFTNFQSIKFFVDFISEKTEENYLIYDNLKEEEKKIKEVEKNLMKNIKNMRKLIKNDISKNNENKIKNFENEIENTLNIFYTIKDSIKNSFDKYINSLCSFSETEEKIKKIKEKYDKQFNEFNQLFYEKINLIFENTNSNINSPRFNYTNNKDKNYSENISNSNEDRIDKMMHFFSTIKKTDKKLNSKKIFMNDIENPELINNNYNNEKLSNNIFKTLNPNIIVNEKECENNNSDFSINDEYESDFSIEKIKRKPYNEYDPFSS